METIRKRTIGGVRRMLRRAGRGVLFGFSAMIGVWLALVVLAIVATLVLRPWG